MRVLLTATVQSHICQFHKPLVEVLHAHNCEVHVAARNNLAEKNGLKLDFVEKVFDIPFSRSPKSADNFKAERLLKKVINEGQYDVIHCNTPMGGIITRIAAKQARKNGARLIYTAHGFHFYEGAPKKNWMVFYPIEKYFSRKNDTLITITKEDYRLAKEKFHCQVAHIHGVGVDEKRYFPVDEAEKRRLRQEMGYGESQKLLLCVGELLPNKNQKMAIRAMKYIKEKYPDAVLFIAGNGPEKDNLEAEIKACGVENNVKMLGYCTHLQDYQHIVDALMSCSYREGLPLNIVEAMLSGTPVVASINRGHKELIQDGETGFLVSANDDKAMADRVLKLLDDEVLAERVGQTACQYAMDYSFTAVKRELEAIYFE
ncbi:Glycosyltransferase involved in cell wall bisynthesis [Ruminococcaceae bacterium P7]|nr:Glycosyltransferase involved in cell wall bisynthesis [Ruminococcaceae bacterium P7]